MAAPTFVADEIVTAAKMNSLPKGQLAYAQITANQSGITTVVDISGLSVTFDAGTSRRIRTTVYVWSLTSTVTADRGHGFIRSGTGTNIQQWVHRFTGTNGEDGLRMDVVETLSGSHTRKVSYLRLSGTGSHTWGAAADAPSFILVEDIGGV